jgi:hypothetical protein
MLGETKKHSSSPAQRSVRAGTPRANSYQLSVALAMLNNQRMTKVEDQP